MMEAQVCYGCNGEGEGIPNPQTNIVTCNRCGNIWWDRTKSAKLDSKQDLEYEHEYDEQLELHAEIETLRSLLKTLTDAMHLSTVGRDVGIVSDNPTVQAYRMARELLDESKTEDLLPCPQCGAMCPPSDAQALATFGKARASHVCDGCKHYFGDNRE